MAIYNKECLSFSIFLNEYFANSFKPSSISLTMPLKPYVIAVYNAIPSLIGAARALGCVRDYLRKQQKCCRAVSPTTIL